MKNYRKMFEIHRFLIVIHLSLSRSLSLDLHSILILLLWFLKQVNTNEAGDYEHNFRDPGDAIV